ncbi:unnamed protein product, partial [Cyprideis torosa]
MMPVAAFAGGGLPWEAPLQTVVNSLTGPVALSIGLLGLFAAGGTLIFGGELTGFAKTVSWIFLAVALMVLGVNIFNTLFGATGG